MSQCISQVEIADLIQGNKISGLPDEAVQLPWHIQGGPVCIEVLSGSHPAPHTCMQWPA